MWFAMDATEMPPEVVPPGKPSWGDAPSWAQGLGVATWDCEYKGEWCWMASAESKYFTHVEKRQA
jgi:hypothetical protein